MKTTNSIIKTKSLSKTYQLGKVRVKALNNVSIDIIEGEMVCIMGKSGSGKSTLLHQLGLIDTPTGGTITIAGQNVLEMSEKERTELRLASLGYVFQEYALLPELTTLENVYLPALMLGRKKTDYIKKATELLDIVGLNDRANHRPSELSGGQQQRVAIARALINDPRILYADEPTANLDSISSETVMKTLQRLNQDIGVTVIFVTHDPDDKKYAQRIIRLHDGKLEDDGR